MLTGREVILWWWKHSPRSGLGTHRAHSRASPTLEPLCAHCSRPSSTPRAWPTSLLDIFLFSVCGASGIRSLKGGLCHGPAGVPRLATRCLCLLSTWLVVCLVPCAPMSIVCPLPSCYLIIVSVAPAVSPSLPSFVSLYSSPCVCSPVLIRCLSCVFVMWVSCWLCSSFLPACLFFPFGVVFVLCFILLLKKPDNLCIWVLDLISCDRWSWIHAQACSSRCRGSRAPQLVEDEWAGPPHIWGIRRGFGTFPSYGGWCASGGGRQGCSSSSGGRWSCSAPNGGRQSCSAPRDAEAGA